MGPFLGGDEGNRTPDPLLAKQVLSQLSYTPIRVRLFPLFNVPLPAPSKLNNAIACDTLDPFWVRSLELFIARFSLERR